MTNGLRIRRAALASLLLATLPAAATSAVVASRSQAASPRPTAPAIGPASAVTSGFVVPDTAYDIPAGALFVDATNGSNVNPGTQASPVATVARAVALAKAGTTIVLRAGVYRESLGVIAKPLTFQAFPHEQAWLSGSVVVTGWTKQSNVWVHPNWTTQFCQTCFDTRAIDPNAPNAGLPDLVFRNGNSLRQVKSVAAMTPGTFFADYANKLLYVADDPTAPGTVIEAATQQRAVMFIAGATGSVVRGLGFQHYASYWDFSQYPAMVVASNAHNMVFDHNIFAFGATRGLAIYAAGSVVTDNDFVQNGFAGLLVNYGHYVDVERNFVAGNNNERFFDGYSPAASSAGMKFTNTYNALVRNNIVQDNYSHGIWFDVSSYNPTVVNNLAQRNDRVGIYIEITEQGLVASNLSRNNGLAGIKLSGATHVRVYNNTMVDNLNWQLSVHDDARNNTDPTQLAMGITWNTTGNQIVNNILSAPDAGSTGPLVFTEDLDRPRIVDAATMITTLDANVYARSTPQLPATFATWTRISPAPLTLFNDMTELHAATGYEPRGIDYTNYSASPIFADPANLDFSLLSTSAARASGNPLPDDVAAAMGVPANASPDRGALVYPSPATARPTPKPVPQKTAPVATFTAQCAWPDCTFDAGTSRDSDGTIAGYDWTFGDGSTATGVNPVHTFAGTGPFTVGLVVTDNDGLTASALQIVAATSVIARDSFARTASNTWGAADVGGSWSTNAPAADWSVANGTGTVSVATAGGSHTAILSGVKVRDVDIRIDTATNKIPAGGTFGQVTYLSARRSLTAASDYRVRLRTPPGGGALRLSFVKVVNGSSETQIGSEVTVPGATYTANQFYALRFRVTGAAPTTLQAKAWVVGTTEPVAWTNTATDSQAELQSAGAVTVRVYLGSSTSNGPVSFSLRNFLVTDTLGG